MQIELSGKRKAIGSPGGGRATGANLQQPEVAPGSLWQLRLPLGLLARAGLAREVNGNLQRSGKVRRTSPPKKTSQINI